MELVKTTAEQREGIYEDVRSLLVPGFLSQAVKIGDLRLSLRTLSEPDFFLLRNRAFGLEGKQQLSWGLAQAVWMVNGSLVENDEGALCELAEAFDNLPSVARDLLNRVFKSLMNRLIEANERIEAFLFENESRVLWKSQGAALTHQTPWLRYQKLHNPVISLWVYYNQMEDSRLSYEREWTFTKFVMAPHAPKAAKKMSGQDSKAEADLKRERQRTLDRVYYEAKGLLDREGKKTEKGESAKERFKSDLIMAETEEELRESMRRWVEGIKDDHDHVVDNVKARIKHGVETRKKDREKQRAALDRALEEEGFSRNQLTPLAGEAGKKFLDRMRSKYPGASMVVDDNTHNSAYKKYIEKNPEVGDLHVDEEGNIVSLSPVNPDMLEMLKRPDDGGVPAAQGPTLQDKITQRRPTLDEGGED